MHPFLTDVGGCTVLFSMLLFQRTGSALRLYILRVLEQCVYSLIIHELAFSLSRQRTKQFLCPRIRRLNRPWPKIPSQLRTMANDWNISLFSRIIMYYAQSIMEMFTRKLK